jgi:hypothetical protein
MFVFALPVVTGAEEASTTAAGTPTFTRDVAPILFDNCVACHRPNHMAPMSLTTYEEARPWARAIKLRVAAREMPPWSAAPGVQKYANDASLSEHEIDTIVKWVDSGAPMGNLAEGWSIGEPDLIFTMLEPYTLPADGTIPYLYFTVPTNLKEDIWISASEFKPTDRRTVHHVIPNVVEGNGKPPDPTPKLARDPSRKEVPGASIAGFVPNRMGQTYPEGIASRIPAGADIEAQLHYTAIGERVTDRSRWGVILAKAPPSKLRKTGGGAVAALKFVIPPMHPNHEVRGALTIDRDTYLHTMMPHMHVRGKDAKYTVIYLGRKVVALWVPKYDFNWQLRYELAEPIFMPKGSTLEVIFHYDNSPNNKYNPDPTAEVRFGEQTWEEMMLGYYNTIEVDGPTGAKQTTTQGAQQ